jgi:Family of unknown function (DUF6893)
MALVLPLIRLTAGAQARRRARSLARAGSRNLAGLHRTIPGVPGDPRPGRGRAFCGPQMRARPTDPHRTATRRHAMRTLRYPAGVIIAAASTAPGLLVVMSLPDARRCLKIRKM